MLLGPAQPCATRATLNLPPLHPPPRSARFLPRGLRRQAPPQQQPGPGGEGLSPPPIPPNGKGDGAGRERGGKPHRLSPKLNKILRRRTCLQQLLQTLCSYWGGGGNRYSPGSSGSARSPRPGTKPSGCPVPPRLTAAFSGGSNARASLSATAINSRIELQSGANSEETRPGLPPPPRPLPSRCAHFCVMRILSFTVPQGAGGTPASCDPKCRARPDLWQPGESAEREMGWAGGCAQRRWGSGSGRHLG